MNYKAIIFIPILKDTQTIPTGNLSKRQVKVLHDLLLEWTTSSTLDNLLMKWEKLRQQTLDMLNITSELSFLLLNISSLKLYLYDLFELLNSLHVSIMVLNGTRHHNDTLKCLSMYLTSFQVFYQKGTNVTKK
jgi:hypothetical protein